MLDFLKSPGIIAAIVTGLLTGVFQWAERRFAPRGRLIWSVPHQHVFVVPPRPQSPVPTPPAASPGGGPVPAIPQPLVVRTRDVWIQNFGRATVREIEIVLNWAPEHFEIWPQRDFTRSENPDHKLIIRVNSLGHREFFVISMFGAGGELPAVINVRSADGVAREVGTHVERNWPRWLLLAMLGLMFFGIFSIVYFTLLFGRMILP